MAEGPLFTCGFTGTRRGMTEAQRETVRKLTATEFQIVRHGDCVGADAEMHSIARSNGQWIVGHPPVDKRLRAFCVVDELWQPKPYFERNRDIVDHSGWLVATSAETAEQPKGGTWWTVRYARQVGRPVSIVWPDGTVSK